MGPGPRTQRWHVSGDVVAAPWATWQVPPLRDPSRDFPEPGADSGSCRQDGEQPAPRCSPPSLAWAAKMFAICHVTEGGRKGPRGTWDAAHAGSDLTGGSGMTRRPGHRERLSCPLWGASIC